MARGSGRSDREKRRAEQRRAERAHAAWVAREQRASEQVRRQQQRDDRQTYLQDQHNLAAARTEATEVQLRALTGVLSGVLDRPAGPLDFESMKTQLQLPELDLGTDATPIPAPRWSDFEPRPPSAVGRLFGQQSRYEQNRELAETNFDRALDEHGRAETVRQRRVAERREAHARAVEQAQRDHAERNADMHRFAEQTIAGERHAASKYFTMVMDGVATPDGFPRQRRARYVPESSLLAIEWELPGISIIPVEREFGYVQSRDMIEVRKRRAAHEIRGVYQGLVSQLALAALHAAFRRDPADLVETVVVNGVVDTLDPATGQPTRPCLLTLRATRDHFERVDLRNVDPVKCVRQHFAAAVSPHPEELAAVQPVLRFDMADPRIVDPLDVMSGMDPRQNLMDLTPTEFESFVQNLFAEMGFEVTLFQAHGDGGIDCIAYDHTPVRGGKYVIQVKHYTKTVPPAATRELYGVVQNEGATKGILITTSGFGQASHEFANGKPLELYDGTHLLALCQQHDVDVRIVMPPRARRASSR